MIALSLVDEERRPAPNAPKPSQATIDMVRALHGPARPTPLADPKLRAIGLYWVRHTPEGLPPGADTIAHWNGRWWSSIGSGSRWTPANVRVLSERLEPPKDDQPSVLSADTRGALLAAAMVGVSRAWPMWWARLTHLPLAFKSYLEPARQPPRDEAFEPPERN